MANMRSPLVSWFASFLPLALLSFFRSVSPNKCKNQCKDDDDDDEKKMRKQIQHLNVTKEENTHSLHFI